MWMKRISCIVLACVLSLGTMNVPVYAAEANRTAPESFIINSVSPRATESFSITVPANSELVANSSFPLVAGETVTITATYSPASASMDFGLISPDGYFYYFNETDGSIDKTMQVSETGDYTFKVRNNSNSAVKVSGVINY